MPQTKRENNDVFYVDDQNVIEKAKVNTTEVDGLVSGFLKIKSAKIRRDVMALIEALTLDDRKA